MLRRFLRHPSNSFVLAICAALAIALVNVSFFPPQAEQRPQVHAEQDSHKSIKSQNSADQSGASINNSSQRDSAERGDEASEYWSIFGHRLKITDSLLVVFAFTLWLATQNLVSGSDDTAQRQLRAYISITHGEGYRQGQVRGWRFEFRPILLNTGQTPAYDVNIRGSIRFLDVNDAATFDWESALPPVEQTGVLTLGREQNRFTRSILDRNLTKAELRQYRQGTHCLFVFGRVTYRDAFDQPRRTNYCFAIAWWGKRAAPLWHTTHRFNDSD